MKKVLICLMIGVYLFGSFSTAFADSRSHNRQFKQKSKSGGHRAHKPRVRHKTGHSSRSQKPHSVQKYRNNLSTQKQHRVEKKHQPRSRVQQPRFKQKHRSDSRSLNPDIQKHRPNRRSSNLGVQKHRSHRRSYNPRYTKRHRQDRHVYSPRYRSHYRPYPRIHYGHRHPYGHRVHILPHGFFSFSIGGLIYYYASGNYYRDYGGYYTVITPPIGALIPVPPPGYRIIYIDSHQYYLSGGVYYVWDEVQRGYRVVPSPEVVHESSEEFPETLESSLNLFAYPNAGQSENEQTNDRYDCHLWAVGETDIDPSLDPSASALDRSDYKRAITACLEARDYTVK